MIRVLIVDDHAIVRTGLRRLLESTEDMEVVAAAGDGYRRSPWPKPILSTWPSWTCPCPR